MRNFNTLDCDIKSCDCSYLHIHAHEGHAITLPEKKNALHSTIFWNGILTV